jgi:hypothetical protein
MSTIIHFECRSAMHLASRSRGGSGGIVMHHGTFGYCDGFASDADHRWIPTGGVFLEQLIRGEGDDSGDDTRYVPHAIGSAGPLHVAR